MAETKGASGRSSGMNVDTKLVRELAELLAETGLTEIEVEDGERKVRVARGGTVMMAAPQQQMAPAQAAAAPAAAPVPEPPAGVEGALKSPVVGTVYLTPEPGAQPCVKVGDSVKQGDTLLIIEAMKVMNLIAADKAGTDVSVLGENAQPLVVIG